MSTKIKNPTDFASALLGALGDPNTKTNVTNITAWEAKEGGNWNNLAKYNPLNTSEPGYGGKDDAPGDAIKAYPNWQSGIDATAATLRSPNYGYPEILSALSNSADWKTFATAVQNSSWDAGHYGYTLASGGAPPASDPNAPAYSIGSNATTADGSSANSPSTTASTKPLTGMAGILQTLDAWYNPQSPQGSLNPLTDISNIIGGGIANAAVMIFVRATSSILALGLMIIGVQTMLHGSTEGGGGGSPQNVLEFVNDAKIQNVKSDQSENESRRKETPRAKENRVWDTMHSEGRITDEEHARGQR